MIRPDINTAKKFRSQGTSEAPNSLTDAWKLNCLNIVRQHRSDLSKGFDRLKESKGLISKENFRRVFNMCDFRFRPDEVDMIIDRIAEKNEEGLILYQKFLKDSDPRAKPIKGFANAKEIFYLMAKVLKKKKISPEEAFEILNKEDTGKITIHELSDAFAAMKLALTREEMENVFNQIDTNNDGQIDYQEFIAILNPIKEQGQGQEVIKLISDHIKQNNMTLLQFTKFLDDDRSGTLNRNKFSRFFRMTGMEIGQNELDTLFEELDPKNTNHVPLRKFIEVLQPYIKEKPRMTSGIEQALILIATYLLEQRSDPYTYFNKFDLNNNGFIERRELKNEIQRMGILISDIELNNLLNFFDDAQDGRISSREFTSHLQPYINTAKKSRSQGTGEAPNSKIIDDLKLKCHKIVRQNSTDLGKGFDLLKDSKGLVSKENFSKVLLMYNLGFVPAEMDLVIDYFTEKNREGLVLYEKFLKNYSDPNFDGADKTIKRLSSAEEIFSRMAKVLKENKISSKEAIRIFDKDNSGKITVQELRDAFAGMKLGLTREEIDDVVRQFDKTNDGQIDSQEFIAALKL